MLKRSIGGVGRLSIQENNREEANLGKIFQRGLVVVGMTNSRRCGYGSV